VRSGDLNAAVHRQRLGREVERGGGHLAVLQCGDWPSAQRCVSYRSTNLDNILKPQPSRIVGLEPRDRKLGAILP
jgi:hypothetical protein